MDANPIRLLKVVPTLMCGGTEHQFMLLARSLDPSRFALEFACLRRWGGFVSEIEARRIPLREYGIRSFFDVNTVVQQMRFARDVRRRRIQIAPAASTMYSPSRWPARASASGDHVIGSAPITPTQQLVASRVPACRLRTGEC
jgi:hypothetical protein